MLRRLGIGFLWAIGGYLVGALGGGFLVYALTTNRFDRDMEAGMTGAFFTGPVLALVAFIAGAVWAGRKRTIKGVSRGQST